MNLLFKKHSAYDEITVYDITELYGEKGSFRILQFSDGAIQGALDLKHPERIVFEYPRAMIHLMEYNNPSFETAFVIGHGIGTIAGHFRAKTLKIAELDPTVLELSKEFFGYRGNHVIIGDGRQILADEQPQSHDYILLDAFTAKGTPLHLASREFFQLAKEKLAPNGAIVLNLFGKGAHDKLINAIHTTLLDQFVHTKAFTLPSGKTGTIQNLVLMASDRPLAYQARHMAGFIEIELGEGHIIVDR